MLNNITHKISKENATLVLLPLLRYILTFFQLLEYY